MKGVKRWCKRHGCDVKYIDTDQDFGCIENDLDGVEIDTTDADDDVSVAERGMQTTKEQTRCIVQSVPFRCMPKLVTRRMVEIATKNLNQFPPDNGPSELFSLLTMLTRRPSPDTKEFAVDFVSHV